MHYFNYYREFFIGAVLITLLIIIGAEALKLIEWLFNIIKEAINR